MADIESCFRQVPTAWDEAVDVVVVGSGFAGLAAAAEAAGLGASVIILEKMPYYGGNSIISGGGFCAWDNKRHLRRQLNLGDDSWQRHLADTLKGGDYYNLPELVEVLVKKAPEGLNFLLEAGAEIKNAVALIGGHSAYRSYHEAQAKGKGFTEPLKNLALGRGAELRLHSQVTHIWRMDANGPVLGVEIRSNTMRTNMKVKRGLVLASGGYGRDVAMRMAYNPSLGPEYNCSNHKGATGEIIRSARAIGADVLHMEFIQLYPCAAPLSGAVDAAAIPPYSGTGFGLIYVNKQGRRFVNELERRDVVSKAQIESGDKPTLAILNRAILEKLAVSSDQIDKGIAAGRIVAASSILELSEKLGILSNALVDSVLAHNGYIRDGYDPEFNKPITPNMMPLVEGPFYAIAQWPSVHYCMGGLRIDKQARVIDIWGRPISKLYAAGEVCGGIHGSNRLGGNAIAECIVFGRIAGINAAKEKE